MYLDEDGRISSKCVRPIAGRRRTVLGRSMADRLVNDLRLSGEVKNDCACCTDHKLPRHDGTVCCRLPIIAASVPCSAITTIAAGVGVVFNPRYADSSVLPPPSLNGI